MPFEKLYAMALFYILYDVKPFISKMVFFRLGKIKESKSLYQLQENGILKENYYHKNSFHHIKIV